MQRQHAIDAGSGSGEAQERRLHPKDDLARNLAQGSGKADELNRVSQAMIAAHEHALARKRLPIPDGLKVPRALLQRLA